MKRRIICCYMALIMVFASVNGYNSSVLQILANDDFFEEVKCGNNAYWSLDAANNELVIFGSGVIDKYTFPKNVESISIGEGITEIGAGAFRNSTLKTVTLPESLIAISDSAFWGCENLVSLELPASIQSIGSAVFEKCSSLTSINIKDGNSTFSAIDGVLYNKNFTELILYPAAKQNETFSIPETVTSVAFCAFDYNKYIKQLYIPRSVATFGEGVPFYKIESIERFIVSDYNSVFCDNDGDLYNKDKTILIKYAIGKSDISFETMSSVTTVAESAFEGAKYLTSVIFSENVNTIEYGALADCSLLKSITVKNPNCTIASSILAGTFINEGLTMFGYSNSTVMQYATNNNINFEPIQEKEVASIEIMSLPKKLTYQVGEALNTVGLVIKIIYNDNTYTERSIGYEVSELESNTVGTKEIIVSYKGKKATFKVEVVEKLENITIVNGKPVTIDIVEANQIACVYFTPSVSGNYNYYATSNSDTVGYIYDEEGKLLAENDDGNLSSIDFYMSYYFTEGVTYTLACKYLNEKELGSFSIVVENPDIEEPSTEDETTGQPQPALSIDGYQISTTVEGFRTIYTVDDPDNQIVSSGLVYGLYDLSENDLVVGSKNNTVYNYESTEAGKLTYNESDTIGTSYAMTMKFIHNIDYYNAKINVRAYAELADGSYIYSDMLSCTVYDLAHNLYQNNLMNTAAGHNYLYNNILSFVNKDYKVVAFDNKNTIM